MSILDIAQARKGKARDGVGKAKAGVSQAGTRVEYGTATSASAYGYVEIIMDNGGSAFTVPCDSPIAAGDRVSYISHAGQGKAVSLVSLTALAEQADTVASEAEAVANATNQHFWTDTDGVHVTEVTQDDWADSSSSDYHSGANILINSLGILLRKALMNLVSITESAIAFYDGLGNAASNITAQFGASGARIGKASDQNIEIDPNIGITFNENGVKFADIHQVSDGGGITLGANSVIVGRDSPVGTTMGIGASGASQAAINLEATAGTNTAGVYLNASAETVTINGALSLTSPLPITSGGTGATGVSSATTGTSVITVASGVTLQSATYRTWGKMAQVLIGVRLSSSLAANATVTIGTIVSGKRPIMATQCGYISNDGYISTTGDVVIRNITGSAIGTSTTIYTAATYLLA